jgi:hypothetical protein
MSTGCATFGNASLAITPLRLLLRRGGVASLTFQLSADSHEKYDDTSAVTPIADKGGCGRIVRFVPIADIQTQES